jgi:Na+/H+-dicarboxylate symporter
MNVDSTIQQTLENFGATNSSTDFKPATTNSWVDILIPANLLEAASKDQFISLIVVTLLFAMAARKIPTQLRNQLVIFAQAVSETTIILVGWLLKLMPLGVFALTFVIASQSGFSFAGSLGFYILAKSGLVLIFALFVYLLPIIVGRIRFRHFAWSILPAQLVAVSTRSSLASLPSLMDCADNRLKLDRQVSGLVLPLSVSAFKLDVALTSFVGLFFLVNIHSIELTFYQIFVFSAGALLFSFAAPGIPTGGLPHQTPLYLALGIPIESVLLLSALGQIPDIFQTLLNVTADISIASVVDRYFKKNPKN